LTAVLLACSKILVRESLVASAFEHPIVAFGDLGISHMAIAKNPKIQAEIERTNLAMLQRW